MRRQETKLSSAVADRIIALLEEGSDESGAWAKKMTRLEGESGPEVYAVLLFVLTHLDFTGAQARDHWGRVLRQPRGSGLAQHTPKQPLIRLPAFIRLQPIRCSRIQVVQ